MTFGCGKNAPDMRHTVTGQWCELHAYRCAAITPPSLDGLPPQNSLCHQQSLPSPLPPAPGRLQPTSGGCLHESKSLGAVHQKNPSICLRCDWITSLRTKPLTFTRAVARVSFLSLRRMIVHRMGVTRAVHPLATAGHWALRRL